jgi:dimethyladenosine transferase 1
MKIYHGDILQFNMEDVFPAEIKNSWEDESPNIHLIGNLPFNVLSSNPVHGGVYWI